MKLNPTPDEIATYWNLAHENHQRSWLCAAIGGSANMQMTGKPFDRLPPALQKYLIRAYEEERDLDFINGA